LERHVGGFRNVTTFTFPGHVVRGTHVCEDVEIAPTLTVKRMQAREIVQKLRLMPHPEGGWYREIHRSAVEVAGPKGARSALTTIYYLLEHAQISRWHVVDADEVWHFYAGAPLELLAYDPKTESLTRHLLEASVEAAEPVAVIGNGVWQAARSLGDYSLVGCTVGPGFDFADFRFISAVADCERHFAGALRTWRHLL
jgi:predicted cupin superfamily sugar epimerase